ncbi:MAG: RHS repeat protein, partial [Armatimonadetes bacterium]|nr:RHS repeat protein [Armatimonadota bacterium]
DAVGRLTSVTDLGETISFSYDAAGNRIGLTDHDARATTYVWDARNSLQSVTNGDNQTTAYQRDALGRATHQTNANGTVADYVFDASGRVTSVANKQSDNTVLSSFAYQQDAVGNPTQITEADNTTVQFGYDSTDRLTGEHRVGSNPYWYEYALDGAGNRTQFREKDGQGNVVGTTNGTYDAANKLLTYGNTSYTWDGNGNLASKTTNNQTTSYTWSLDNKPVGIDHPNATVQEFTYDGDGVRTSASKDGVVTKFLHDADGLNVVAELDANGTTTARQSYGDGFVSEWRGGAHRWPLYTALGTTAQLTDAAQTVTDSYVLDAFGNPVAQTGQTATPYKYVGRLSYNTDATS